MWLRGKRAFKELAKKEKIGLHRESSEEKGNGFNEAKTLRGKKVCN